MFIVKNNLSHSGKPYVQGSEIKKSDPNFDVLFKAGYVTEVGGQAPIAPVAEPEPVVVDEAPEEPVFEDDEGDGPVVVKRKVGKKK